MNEISLNKLPENKPIAIIIRHAKRHPIVNMKRAIEALLTEDGKTDAYEFGKKFFRFCPIRFYHSPVTRCKETAEFMLKGLLDFGCDAEINGQLIELGAPYIKGDWQEISNIIDGMGMLPFTRKWFNGEVSKDLMLSLKESAHITLQVLIDQLNINETSTINVAHDWNVIILREYFFGLKHEDIGPPPFLDGIAAYFEDMKIVLKYHDETRIVNLPLE